MEKVNRGHLAGLELFARLHDSDLDYMLSEDIGNLIAQASAAPEQEAVATVSVKFFRGSREMENIDYQPLKDLPEGTHRLYTHVDPSEVERLRAELKTERLRADAAVGDANEAERKLDEAQALLRDTKTIRGLGSLPARVAFAKELGVAKLGGVEDWIQEVQDRIDAFLFATDQPAERNQCDGCQAGIPLVDGVHRMGKPGGYPDAMSCQASKYANPAEGQTNE